MAKICTEPGCDREVTARGLCRKHYLSAWRAGELVKIPILSREERFWSHVDKRGPAECWPWIPEYRDQSGYGRFGEDGSNTTAHRVAWEIANGRSLPSGKHVDHVWERGCRRKDCVNPAHLEDVTQKENNRRKDQKYSEFDVTLYCRRGHLRAEHGRFRKSGKFECKLCAKMMRNKPKDESDE